MLSWCYWFVITATALGIAAIPARAETNAVTFSEFPEESAALVAATVAYFDAIEADVVPSTGPSVITLAPRPVSANAGPLSDHGPVRHLTGYRITWYPMDRLTGIVDFMGTWDGNRNLVCGYLTWHLGNPDAPALADVSATFVTLSELDEVPDVKVFQRLSEANCAFGEIDANFRVFDVGG